MARIRTIKPEFWTSEQVMACDPLSRLLFIGLWNFCDDAGNHPASPITIKALVFPGDSYDSATIRRLLDDLSANGLLRLYHHSGKDYVNVAGWRHQKIEKPTIKYPKYSLEAQALYEGMRVVSHVVDDSSTTPRRLLDDSSATEGKGKGKVVEEEQDQERCDLLTATEVQSTAVVQVKRERKPAPRTEAQEAAARTWAAYSLAYFERYQTEPVRNQTVNAQIASLVKRIGMDDSPMVAAYFVGMNKRYYVEKLHPVGLLLADCEAIRTQWATNRQVTNTRAGQMDKSQANYDLVSEALALMRPSEVPSDY